MAVSATSICNLALAEAPCAPIQDLAAEDSKPAAECRRVYRQAVGELLESSRWTFATRRARLAETDNPRFPAWGYAYALPSDLAVLQAVFTAPAAAGQGYAGATAGQGASPLSGVAISLGSREPAFSYERDERRLYTDAPNAVAEYTATDPDETAFPPLFVRALAYDIAARICTPLTGDASKKAQFVQLAEQARSRAMAADLNRRPSVLDPMPEALAVR